MKIIITLLLSSSLLFSLDFITAVLKAKKGDTLVFKTDKVTIFCHPHGIYTIANFLQDDNFLNDAEKETQCQKELRKILPNINRRYAKELRNKLHLEQTYYLSSKDGVCNVTFNDSKTYSQILVEHGLGVIAKGFESEDKWFMYSLNKAQKLAKDQKRGIWATPFISTCFEALK
ncbi:MAG: thermonuclease family protein [Campylobacterota bacterium]